MKAIGVDAVKTCVLLITVVAALLAVIGTFGLFMTTLIVDSYFLIPGVFAEAVNDTLFTWQYGVACNSASFVILLLITRRIRNTDDDCVSV